MEGLSWPGRAAAVAAAWERELEERACLAAVAAADFMPLGAMPRLAAVVAAAVDCFSPVE